MTTIYNDNDSLFSDDSSQDYQLGLWDRVLMRLLCFKAPDCFDREVDITGHISDDVAECYVSPGDDVQPSYQDLNLTMAVDEGRSGGAWRASAHSPDSDYIQFGTYGAALGVDVGATVPTPTEVPITSTAADWTLGGEKLEIKDHRRLRHPGRYMRCIVAVVKNRFGCPIDNAANRLAVRRCALEHMVRHGLRPTHINQVIDRVVEHVFIPNDSEVYASRLQQSRAARQRYRAARRGRIRLWLNGVWRWLFPSVGGGAVAQPAGWRQSPDTSVWGGRAGYG